MMNLRKMYELSERWLDMAIARENEKYQERHMRWGERMEKLAAAKGWDYVPGILETYGIRRVEGASVCGHADFCSNRNCNRDCE